MSAASRASYIGRSIARGAGWVIALRVFIRLLGIISTVILARLLTPEDYGIVALATVIAGGLEMLTAFNFEVWLIRHPDTRDEHYHTVWTLSVIRNLGVALVMAALAYPASLFFEDSRLQNVLYVLALVSALGGFQNVGIVQFQKELQFEREFVLFSAVKLGAFFATVSLAILLRSYWALLGGIFMGRMLQLVLSFRLHDFRPRFRLCGGLEIFNFSKWLLTGSAFAFLYMKSHAFILGKMLGNQSLGLYTMASEISDMAATELLMPLRRVLMPAYSKLIDDLDALRSSFLDTVAVIFLIGVPIATGIGLVAEPLVWVALGDKWLETIPLLQILVVYGLASIGIANQGPVLIALGDTRVLSHLYAFGALVLIPCVIWAAQEFGVRGVAMAVSGVHLLVFLVSMRITLSRIQLPVSSLIGRVWRVVLATLVMAVGVALLKLLLLPYQLSHLATLGLCAALGCASYILVLLGLWQVSGRPEGGERVLFDFIYASARKSRRASHHMADGG